MDNLGNEVELRTSSDFVGIEVTRSVRHGMAGPARLHDRWTLSLLEDGEEHLWRHGALETETSGQVAIYAPGDIEVVLRRPTTPSRRIDVCFDQVPLPARGADGSPAANPPAAGDVAQAVVRFAAATIAGNGTGMAEQALRTLGAALRAAPAEPTSRAEPGSVARARRFLLGHPNARVNLRELADVAGISEGHLVRIFHAWVGVPPHTYLLHLRVSAARKLLARGLPCGAAAQDAGFADSSHLTRLFRRLLGFTPSHYSEARGVWDAHHVVASRWSRPVSVAV